MPTENHFHEQHTPLPEDLRPFFWSYRFGDLDLHEDEKTIISSPCAISPPLL